MKTTHQRIIDLLERHQGADDGLKWTTEMIAQHAKIPLAVVEDYIYHMLVDGVAEYIDYGDDVEGEYRIRKEA
jgi:hypothetical protein